MDLETFNHVTLNNVTFNHSHLIIATVNHRRLITGISSQQHLITVSDKQNLDYFSTIPYFTFTFIINKKCYSK